MNSVFLIGEVLNDINIINIDGIDYTTNFVIKNGLNEFEIQCTKELAKQVYNNTSKGDIVAVQGRLSKHKNDITKIMIFALSVQEFRNEKTNARLMYEVSEQNENISNNILKNMDKNKICELFSQIEKIIDIVNTNKKEDIINNDKKEDLTNTIQHNQNIQLNDEEKIKHERQDAQTLI